jgi:hypothetical protein
MSNETVSLSDTKKLARIEDMMTGGVGQLETQADLDELLNSGRPTADIVTLDKPGKFLRGTYQGLGSGVDFEDKDGRQVIIATHVFDAGRLSMKLKGTHQLDQELPFYVGREVTVVKIGQEDTRKGQRVNRFRIVDHEKDAEDFGKTLAAWSRRASELAREFKREHDRKPEADEFYELVLEAREPVKAAPAVKAPKK